jgi:hypothetical protein
MIKSLILLSIIVLSLESRSALLKAELSVSGILLSYDKATVTLQDEASKKSFKIPRSRVHKIEGYISGSSFVQAKVLPSELISLNKQ